MTRQVVCNMLEEMQDRDGSDFAAPVRDLEEKNRMLQKLKTHHEIECENNAHYLEWKNCQQAR